MLIWLRSTVDAIVGRVPGKQDRVDTATRMWLDADLTGRGAMEAPGHEPQTADPIDELRRLIRGRGETQ